MRLISQDGDISYPFETILVRVFRNKIYLQVIAMENFPIETLGEYKTAERAIEVFNELHRHYTQFPNNVFFMPKE